MPGGITLFGFSILIVTGVLLAQFYDAVTVEEDEDFHADYTLPADIQSGGYQVTAISGEGETLTASVDAEAGSTEAVMPAEPAAELMQLDRSKSAGEWSAIGVGVLVSAGLGLALVFVKK